MSEFRLRGDEGFYDLLGLMRAWAGMWERSGVSRREAFEVALDALDKLGLPSSHPLVSEPDLPGMWEEADLSGGATDQEASKPEPTACAQISIDFKQATNLLAMFGGEAAEITLSADSEGLVAYYTAYPEEGSVNLGVTDEEATPESKEASKAVPVADEMPKQNWAPYLSDRADGVRGHFAIARWNTRGYREVWNLRTHRWAAYSDEVLTRPEAEALLEAITIPSQPEPKVPVADEREAENQILRAENDSLRSTLDRIAAMDEEGVRADDLGRAALTARTALANCESLLSILADKSGVHPDSALCEVLAETRAALASQPEPTRDEQ